MSKHHSASYTFDTIFTLEARSNVALEVMRSYFQLNDQQVFQEIQGQFRELRTLLASKGVEYSKLKGALVPNIGDRHERAFVFDSSKAASGLYGREAIHAILPNLDVRSTHSVLCGDWLYTPDFGAVLAASPPASEDSEMVLRGGRGDTLFFVYLNNLSPSATLKIHNGLLSISWYLGFLDLDLASPIKTCLSVMLIRDFIKQERLIVGPHEDDRNDGENVNLSLCDFESFGLSVRSVPQMLYGIFLSYKIERPVVEGESDTNFSLNAITSNPIGFDRFDVVLEERKLEYLKTEKLGSLKKAGLVNLDEREVVDQIRSKLMRNYIYNLSRSFQMVKR